MSQYFISLQNENIEAAGRYKHKLECLKGVDPFALDDIVLSKNPDDFPPVSNMDIVSYLVLTTSYYTNNQMKAYKSLNAFKYFDAGFVNVCGALKISDLILVIGKVKHSQKLNLPPVNVWVACRDDGSVETAHCTCMAGLGEVCSHVGAILFSLEFITTSRNNTSCTDIQAMWKVPSVSKVEYKPLKSMTFGKVAHSPCNIDVPALSTDDITQMLQDIQLADSSSVLMAIMEPFASQIAESNNFPEILNPYEHLFREEYESFSLEELQKIASTIDIKMTKEDCNKICEATKEQANSSYWCRQRIGRLTASNSKNIYRTSLLKPSVSLIKTICYPLDFNFNNKATKWGKTHEKDALNEYKREQNTSHENLVVTATGLWIDPTYPYLGATPDSLVSCSCCGLGCVEVKCPYLLKNSSITSYSKLKDSCLETCDEGICLKKNHSYYFQIQQQMALTNTKYCDFVMWSPTELFIERIIFNEDFWFMLRTKCIDFHQRIILPELLGKFFTKNNVHLELYCLCKKGDDKRPMICCDNDNCIIKWYHMECIGLAEVPVGFWLCPYCLV